ncbi:hypothetical protein [Kitasatospora sp. NPDC085879]|uniref:hypothetical protein n=1 Tax=Kitasatospora sp. NPDC085879 TaxID=3154769 RepID=UPI00341940B3
MLARTTRQGRAPVPLVTGTLLRSVRDSSPTALREAITASLRRFAAELTSCSPAHESNPTKPGEDADDSRAEALLANAAQRAKRTAGRIPETHTVLLDLAAEQDLDFHDIPRMPEWKQPGSLMTAAFRLFAGGPEALRHDEAAEALGLALGMPEEKIDAMRHSIAAHEVEALRRGEEPWPLPATAFDAESMIAAANAASDQELLRAAQTTVHATSLQGLALLGSILGLASTEDIPLRMDPEGVRRMLQHPVWWCWGQFVGPGPQREEDLAARIAMALPPGPADTDALQAYADFLRTEHGLPDEHPADGENVHAGR